jgi:hypothetical protein
VRDAIEHRDADVGSGGNITHQIVGVWIPLKEIKNGFKQFRMIMVAIVGAPTEDMNKGFHRDGIKTTIPILRLIN